MSLAGSLGGLSPLYHPALCGMATPTLKNVPPTTSAQATPLLPGQSQPSFSIGQLVPVTHAALPIGSLAGLNLPIGRENVGEREVNRNPPVSPVIKKPIAISATTLPAIHQSSF